MSEIVAVCLLSWDEAAPLAVPVRHAVFVAEQHVPKDMELDEHDATALHAVATKGDGTAVGTGRLLPDGHIGRVAVLPAFRGQGIGGRLLAALVGAAQARGDTEVWLNAQTGAESFYAEYGFEPRGEVFMEAGIPHRLMHRRLDRD